MFLLLNMVDYLSKSKVMFINIQSILIFKHQYITEYHKGYVYQKHLYRAEVK